MFSGCTALTAAPSLPATTLVDDCYYQMFSGCTALTAAPSLPATSLLGGYRCYIRMFYGCTSLTTAPSLPATTLVDDCYYQMFQGCTALTAAPSLPATKLASNCYSNMFNGCTKLSLIKVHFTAWGTQTSAWVSNVPSTGTFYKPSALPDEFSTNRIPTGWTVVNID